MYTLRKALLGAVACGSLFAATAKDNFGSPTLKVPENAETLTIAFSDTALWDGKRVPRTMQCRALGGQQSASPGLVISGSPDRTKSLVVFFENPSAHDNHGLIQVGGVRHHESNWRVPPIRNHAPADKLPTGIDPFDGGNTWGNAYNSPCPTQGSWLYTVTVYALDENDVVVGVGKREIGYAP